MKSTIMPWLIDASRWIAEIPVAQFVFRARVFSLFEREGSKGYTHAQLYLSLNIIVG